MPRNSPPPYIAAASSSSPRCLSVSSLKQLSPNPFSESTTDSHEKHSPTTPVNKFSQSQVNLLGNRISQLIQMMEAESPSEGAETGKPVVGHKSETASTIHVLS